MKKISFVLLSFLSFITSAAQETLADHSQALEIAEDVVEVTDGYPVSDTIISILVFVAFVWMIGHMIYELWIKRNPFTAIDIDQMKVLRETEGKRLEMSDDEYNECMELLTQATDNWTEYQNEDGEEMCIITNKKQMQQTEDIANRVNSLLPTDPEVVELANQVYGFAREARKREFTGSKTLLVILVIIAAFFIYLTGWQIISFFIFNAATYILASMTPNFMLYRKELKGKTGSGCLTAILGGAFAMILGAQTVRTVTKWSDGSTTTDDDHSQHFIAWILAIIIAVILVFFMFVWATINYLRNYVIYR